MNNDDLNNQILTKFIRKIPKPYNNDLKTNKLNDLKINVLNNDTKYPNYIMEKKRTFINDLPSIKNKLYENNNHLEKEKINQSSSFNNNTCECCQQWCFYSSILMLIIIILILTILFIMKK